jgi:hypothetical protein
METIESIFTVIGAIAFVIGLLLIFSPDPMKSTYVKWEKDEIESEKKKMDEMMDEINNKLSDAQKEMEADTLKNLEKEYTKIVKSDVIPANEYDNVYHFEYINRLLLVISNKKSITTNNFKYKPKKITSILVEGDQSLPEGTILNNLKYKPNPKTK